MRNIYILLLFIILSAGLRAQSAEPSVNGSSFTPFEVEVGSVSTLSFNWSNNSFDPIPANSIEFIITPDSNFYQNNGLFTPVNTGFSDFTWVHEPSTDTWRGTNNSQIPGLATLPFSAIEVSYEGVNVSNGVLSPTLVALGIIANPGSFINSTANDTLRPLLGVVPATSAPVTIDTVRASLDEGSDTIICPDNSQLPNGPGSVSICGNGNAVVADAIVTQDSCIQLTGSVFGSDTICVVICDDVDNMVCDTSIVVIAVLPGLELVRSCDPTMDNTLDQNMDGVADFCVVRTDTASPDYIGYQWLKDGVELVNDTLSYVALDSSTEGGTYQLVVEIIGGIIDTLELSVTNDACSCAEICDDFIDNDGDGYEDFFDPDCPDYNPFECSVSDIYLVADNGPNTGLYRVNLVSGVTTEITNQIGSPGGDIININISVGISPKDNFMYGLFRSNLFRIDASGRALFVGNVSGTGFDPTSRYNNATFGPDGTFYVSNQSPTRNVYAIDVDPLSPTYLEATLINSTTVATSDIAFNPADGQIYSVTAAEELLQFDPSTGTETNLGVVAGLADVGYNATFMVGEQTLMAFANGGALYRIDIDALTAELDSISGPMLTGTADRSDGASNAFCLSLLKDAVDTAQLGDTVTYTFSLNNRTGDTILNAVFIDALPSGAIYASGAQNASAGLVIENTDLSGLTDARLGISSIDTGLHTFTLDVVVTSCDAVGETLLNQALVDSFQTLMVFSDDPSTGRLADSTSIVIINTVGVQLVCPTDTTLYGCDTSVANAANYPVIPTIIGGCGVDSLWNMDEIVGLACGDSIVRTWFVLDSLGNVDSCKQSIVVSDTTAPMLSCMGTDTVYLDANGMAMIVPSDLSVVTNDNCAIDSLWLDRDTFSCTDIVQTISVQVTAQDSCGNINTCEQSLVVLDSMESCLVCIQPRVLLQGALIDLIDASMVGTLMRDDLRQKRVIPLTQPYSVSPFFHFGVETIVDSATVLGDLGFNSVVDWVLLEFRDPADSSVVLFRRAGLVQVDGDVVNTDGISCIEIPAGEYFVSIRHRNHFGVMTASSMLFTNNGEIVDFTSIELYEKPDEKETPAFVAFGNQILWSGDVDQGGQILLETEGNDTERIRSTILNDPGNLFLALTYIVKGYFAEDNNMNGEVKLQSSENDVNIIRVNLVENSIENIFGGTGYTDFMDNLPD